VKHVWIAVVGIFAAAQAHAQTPAALVEDVTGTPAGVEFMDYLPTGRVITLGAGDTLVIGYLRSCVRETIKGGTVTVGSDSSAVVGGTVTAEKVKCDGGGIKLALGQSAKSGVMVFRAPPKSAAGAPPAAQLTLYGLSPVIDLKGGGLLVIERLDEPGERHQVQIAAQQLVRGTFYDFAKSGVALAAGGLYRASTEGRAIVFKVDPFAQPGQAPVVGRLLRFPAAS
jgi:hypothetical protein